MAKQARPKRLAACLAAALAAPPAVSAEGPPALLRGGQDYTACMRLARTAPTEGFETALAWGDRGGGAAAKHCAATALFSMGQYGEAAVRFESLAHALEKEKSTRGRLLAQAGQAWQQAGEIDRAFAVQSQAIELLPDDPEIRIDRAMVLAERGHYQRAVADLDAALAADPGQVTALVLRASAHRRLDALDRARADVARALELSPHQPEALLESGIIKRLEGDSAGARRDWLTLLRLYQGTPAADAAQRNLEKLDVKVE